jgi:glyoxylase-like metal-dependent hydrolase (beta-lactamase superfamily II)
MVSGDRSETEPDVVDEVGPGIWRIRQPIPDAASVAFTFCYLVEDAQGALHVIDPGWKTEDNWTRLARATAFVGRATTAIATVVVTHLHADHLGLADVVRDRTDARVALLADEAAALRTPMDRWDAGRIDEQLRRWGTPAAPAAELSSILRRRAATPAFDADLKLVDGDLIDAPGRRLRVMATPGHTTGHLCLLDEDHRMLFTGDHVLPRMNPGIGLGAPARTNPLEQYLASLDRAEQLDASGMPGHQHSIADVAERAHEIRLHHLRRAAEIERLQRSERLSVWETASRLDWHTGWLALTPYRRHSALAQVEMHLRRLGLQEEPGPW